MPGGIGWVAEIWGHNAQDSHQLWVFQARADAAFDLVQGQVGGHHQRQLVDVAIINDLEEFFLSPVGGVLRAEIVQHQQTCGSYFFHTVFKGNRWTLKGKA